MTLTTMSDLEVAPARRRLAAEPSLTRRPVRTWATTSSACAHSGARRAARHWLGTAGAARRTRPGGGTDGRAECRQQQLPKVRCGGPSLL